MACALSICAFHAAVSASSPMMAGGHHERGLGLVHVALAQLRVREARAVPHELVRERPAHPLEEQRVVRVLEHRPVPLLLDVLQVLPRAAVRGVLLAHVAEPPGELGEALAVGALAHPLHGEVAGLREVGAGEDGDFGFGVEMGHLDDRWEV